MSYVVLARKWRPQTFSDLIGQGHVSRTLGNAIAAGRVAHAFLFTGVRGVGKTTSARILAKALNCERGPTAEPCLACAACREIGEGTDLDVLEIDGATYTGVDKVRELQETLPYRPSRDRFKIFIVDEVHMLSQGAWNAFLKTLEEPPPHVKFIFATTEVHKVPVTILSRCQRYDFKLIGPRDITGRLRHVLDAEHVAADDDALRVIAREAAGSMRDAMSLLDQVIAWAGEEGLTGEGVARVLGVAAHGVLHRMSGALLAHDAATCLEVVGELAQQGFSLPHVARDFLRHLRDLVVARVGGDPARLELAEDELADVQGLAARTSLEDLSRLYLGFSRAYDDVARNADPRSAFEMALVRLSHRPPLVALDDLMGRIADLERRLLVDGVRQEGAGPKGLAGLDPAREHLPSPAVQPPRAAPSAAHEFGTLPSPTSSDAPHVGKREPSGGAARGAIPAAGEHDLAARSAARAEPDMGERHAPARSGASPAPEGTSDGPTPRAPASGDVDLGQWRAVLDRLAEDKPLVASVLEQGALLRSDDDRFVIGFPPGSFALGQLGADGLDAAARAASALLGRPVLVTAEASEAAASLESVAATRSAERQAELDEARRRVSEHPLVKAALELLHAELREVRLHEGS